MKIHSAQSISFKENKTQAKPNFPAIPTTKTENKPLPSSKKDNNKTAKTIGIISGAVVLVGAALYAFRERLGLVKVIKKESKKYQDEFKREVENKTEVIKEEIITQVEKGKEKAREVIQEIKIEPKKPQLKTQTEAQVQIQKIKESAEDINFEEVIEPVAKGAKTKAEEIIEPVAIEVKAAVQETKPLATELKAIAQEAKPLTTEVKTGVQEAKTVKAEPATENVAKKGQTATKTKAVEKGAQQAKPVFANKYDEYIKGGQFEKDKLTTTAVEKQLKFREYWENDIKSVVHDNKDKYPENEAFFKEMTRIARDFEKDAHHPINNPNGRMDSAQQAANILEQSYMSRFFNKKDDGAVKAQMGALLAEVSKPNNPLMEMYKKMPFEEAIDRLITLKVKDLTYSTASGKEAVNVFDKIVKIFVEKLSS